MKLIYTYIRSFKNIHDQEIAFSDDFEVTFDNGRLSIAKGGDESLKSYLYGNNLTKDLHIIIGRTGAGKTNLMQLIGMEDGERMRLGSDCAYFLLYSSVKDSSLFSIEMHNMVVPEIAKVLNCPKKVLTGLDRVDFRYDFENGRMHSIELARKNPDEYTAIVNTFDRYSFSSYPYSDIIGGTRNGGWLERTIRPYNEVFPGEIVIAAKEYVDSMPEVSLKRKASFVINRQNWQFRSNIELDADLVNTEYWTYGVRRQDGEVHTLTDIPYASMGGGFRKTAPPVKKKPSVKQQFIHDLMTDYAIFLRKVAASVEEAGRHISTLRPKQQRGVVTDPGILPDGQPNLEIGDRIDWLCQYIDYHTDETYGNIGLMWQIGDDIRDLGKILEKMPDRYFTKDTFSCPLVEIDVSYHSPFYDLFERMGQYHKDQLGVFDKELLPYELTYLSSGEFQYAKIWGTLDSAIKTRIQLGGGAKGSKILDDFSLILLMDEPENYMHPEFCRQFIDRTNTILKRRRPDMHLQLIMTTHSPFMLSDTLSSQITRMDYDDNGECVVLEPTETSYFAANIHSIMADGFFLDYTIGEFSRRFLSEKYQMLKSICAKEVLSDSDKAEIENAKKLLPLIGDTVIRAQFFNLVEGR